MPKNIGLAMFSVFP